MTSRALFFYEGTIWKRSCCGTTEHTQAFSIVVFVAIAFTDILGAGLDSGEIEAVHMLGERGVPARHVKGGGAHSAGILADGKGQRRQAGSQKHCAHAGVSGPLVTGTFLCIIFTKCLQSSNIIATEYSVVDSQLVMVRMQAHARLMARHIVSRQDAAVAIMLVEACSDTSGSLSSGDVLQSRCPADPDTEHMKVEARITTTLSAWQGTLNNY
jgi:hypothetical protein